jgi:hypothetical protein
LLETIKNNENVMAKFKKLHLKVFILIACDKRGREAIDGEIFSM